MHQRTYTCPACDGSGGHRYYDDWDECRLCGDPDDMPGWMADAGLYGRVTAAGLLGFADIDRRTTVAPKRPITHKGRPNRRYRRHAYLATVAWMQRYAGDSEAPFGNASPAGRRREAHLESHHFVWAILRAEAWHQRKQQRKRERKAMRAA